MIPSERALTRALAVLLAGGLSPAADAATYQVGPGRTHTSLNALFTAVDLQPGDGMRVSADQWSGYDAERTRVLDFLGTRRPANPIVLTGDIHSNWVNDLKVDFLDPRSPVVATEFVGTSISSSGNGADNANFRESLMKENCGVKFFNGQRGYVRCTVTPDSWRSDYQIVEKVTEPGAAVKTRASFTIESGRPGAQAT